MIQEQGCDMHKNNMKGDKLTLKQKQFADKYLETGNATEAASQVYDVDNRNVANTMGSENLAKPSIIEYLVSKQQLASDTVVELCATAKNETVRLNSAKDILDRTLGKAPQSINMNVSQAPIIDL